MLEIKPLQPDLFYHIYNHAVDKNNIFVSERNYEFFLQRYAEHIEPIANTYAFCLLPNHFHFAVKIKSPDEIKELRTLSKFQTLTKFTTGNFLSKQFSNLFSSYTQAFNKQQDRSGTLFQRPFKRKPIDNNEYFKNLIYYIHYNPVHHGFVRDLRDWKWSSFESYFSEKATKLKRDEVISWFKDKNSFYLYHKKQIDEKMFFEFEYM